MAKTQEKVVEEIESDIHMTVKRRAYAYAGEHAGWLDRAAKRTMKVECLDKKTDLFVKIVRRALKLLRAVDDSNASLQSIIWEGSWCFAVWKDICAKADEDRLKDVLAKILPEDVDGLADGLFFPESLLPITDEVLRRLLAFVQGNLKFKEKYRREKIDLDCLGWIAQLKDEVAFDKLCARMPNNYGCWKKRFNLCLNLERYDEAVELAKKNNEHNARYVRELTLQVAERSGNRELMMEVALAMAEDRPSKEEFRRIAGLLTDLEKKKFIEHLMSLVRARPGFDMGFCEILFEAGEVAAVHEYAVSRYDEIFNVGYCTGMIPLGKKLYKKGDSLAACVFLRGAIWYLMCTGNSKYYADVHGHRAVLAEVAATVTDWESVPTQVQFDDMFALAFANRRSFWY